MYIYIMTLYIYIDIYICHGTVICLLTLGAEMAE